MFTEGVLLSEFTGLTCACLQVFEWVMCSEAKADAHRFRDIILAAIDDNKVKLYKKFKAWSEKVAKQPRPKAPLAPKKANASEAADGQNQLVQQIRCSDTVLLTS